MSADVHPFLEKCCEVLDSGDAGDVSWSFFSVSEDDRNPVLIVTFKSQESWSHDVDYDVLTGRWRRGAFADSELVELSVTSNRTVRPVGEDGFEVSLRLEAPRDLIDLIEFYRNARRYIDRTGTVQSLRLSKLVSGVQVSLPLRPEPSHLDLSDPILLRKLPDGFTEYLDAYLAEDDLSRVVDLGGLTWPMVVEKWASSLADLAIPSGAPGADELQSPPGGESEFPEARLRLNPKRAFPPYLRHVLTLTEEGAAASERVLEPKDSVLAIPELLATQEVPVQTDRMVQVREALEVSTISEALDRKLSALGKQPEPADQVNARLRLRLELADLVERAYMEEAHALVRPLPYLLEKPYRLFLRAGDPREKVARGIFFLGVLLKVMALLPLEEALASKEMEIEKDAVDSVQERVELGRPASDGEWLKLFRRLHRAGCDRLPAVGQPCAAFAAHDEALQGLVSLRNDWAHSSKTLSSSFIADFGNRMATEYQTVLQSLRTAFSELELVIPDNLRMEDGELRLKARSLMGADSDFPIVERIVQGELATYPSGKLVLLHPTAPLVVERYFRCSERTTDILDIRLFDKVQDGRMTYFSIDFPDAES